MQVSKWGNSLAIRLPAVIVEALNLKEGDEVDIQVAGARTFCVARDRTWEEVLKRLQSFKKKLPPDWKFDRNEINSR